MILYRQWDGIYDIVSSVDGIYDIVSSVGWYL